MIEDEQKAASTERDIQRGETSDGIAMRQENIAGMLIGIVVLALLGAFGVAWIVSYAGY